MTKPGRNDPCWCGSAKKYKKCHLRSDESGLTRPDGEMLAGHSAPVLESRHQHLLLDPAQRDGMRAAGRFNAEVMDYIRPLIKPGIRTIEIDRLVHDYTVEHGAIPACLGYRGFPKSCCTSVNEVICHGIPNDYELQDGDIINVDLTSIVDGWHGDQSEMFLIGDVDEASRRLIQVTFDCLYLGIEAIKPHGRVIDIGRAITSHAHEHGLSVVRDYQGHGIGRVFHQDPGVPHFPDSGAGQFVIEPGMCFTIEPMINLGSYRTQLDRGDDWTVRTTDGKRSAQFEHTLLMTETGIETLTLTEHGPRPGHVF